MHNSGGARLALRARLQATQIKDGLNGEPGGGFGERNVKYGGIEEIV
jgi:hypothetical protein